MRQRFQDAEDNIPGSGSLTPDRWKKENRREDEQRGRAYTIWRQGQNVKGKTKGLH